MDFSFDEDLGPRHHQFVFLGYPERFSALRLALQADAKSKHPQELRSLCPPLPDDSHPNWGDCFQRALKACLASGTQNIGMGGIEWLDTFGALVGSPWHHLWLEELFPADDACVPERREEWLAPFHPPYPGLAISTPATWEPWVLARYAERMRTYAPAALSVERLRKRHDQLLEIRCGTMSPDVDLVSEWQSKYQARRQRWVEEAERASMRGLGAVVFYAYPTE